MKRLFFFFRVLGLVVMVFLGAINPSNAQLNGISNVATVLSVSNGLQVAHVPLPDATRTVDYPPQDPNRPARTDYYGLLKFIPVGGVEGVYSFTPYTMNYAVESPEGNALFVQEAQWSPNGQQVAFIISQPQSANDAQGVWFWQPAQELATDPSYQLLRHCPPSCDQVDNPENLQWQATRLQWASDNSSILIHVRLLNEGRDALVVRYARRDETNAQPSAPLRPLRFEDGYWTVNGARLVVSGRSASQGVGFGVMNADGGGLTFTSANEIGMAWVQDAVQHSDGTFYMLASATDSTSPLSLVDGTGKRLTVTIGNRAPSRVLWNDERTAVYVETGSGTNKRAYVAQINGTLTDITESLGDTTALTWVTGLPATAQLQNVPAPLATKADLTPKVGDILRVIGEQVIVYTEPTATSAPVGTLTRGQELMVIADPLREGDAVWYRVQGIDYGGWVIDLTALTFAEDTAP